MCEPLNDANAERLDLSATSFSHAGPKATSQSILSPVFFYLFLFGSFLQISTGVTSIAWWSIFGIKGPVTRSYRRRNSIPNMVQLQSIANGEKHFQSWKWAWHWNPFQCLFTWLASRQWTQWSTTGDPMCPQISADQTMNKVDFLLL